MRSDRACAILMSSALLAALVLSGGCATTGGPPGADYFISGSSTATVYVDPASSSIRKVALMPFKAPTELIGGSVSEIFVTELLKSHQYILVERSQIAKVLGESELSLSGMTSSKAVELGTMLGADGVIVGTVDQYATKAVKGETFPVVGATVRLIDCKTAKVAWSGDLASMGDSGRETLAMHSRKVVHDIVTGLFWEWQKHKPPAAPENTSVSDMGLREAVLRWNKPKARGTKHIIERGADADGPFKVLAEVAASEGLHRDSDLKDAQTYYYRITAVGANGLKTGPGEVMETFTAPPPGPPIGLASESDFVQSVPLSWMKPAETMYVSGYVVMRSESKGGPYEKIQEIRGVDTLSFYDGGMEPGTLGDDKKYYYKVITVNEAGAHSPESEVVSAITRKPPPVVGSVVAISAKPREIPVSWQTSEDEKTAGYIISRSDDGVGEFAELKRISGRSANQWVDRGGEKKSNRIGRLKDGTKYSYQVAAYNIANTESVWSDVVSAVTKKVPATPSIPRCKEGQPCSVRLDWDANPESDIANYVVVFSESATGKYRECSRSESPFYDHIGRGCGVEYFYKVKAVDADTLESEWSEAGSATTKPSPDAPTSLSVSDSDEGYMLSWTAPTQSDITSYVIQKKGLLKKSTLGYSNEAKFLLTPEQVGKSLQVFVVAKDKDGLESSMSELCVVTSAP